MSSNMNVGTPRGGKSSLTAVLTLEVPDGNVTEFAIKELCESMIQKHLGLCTKAKIEFTRTVRQEVQLTARIERL